MVLTLDFQNHSLLVFRSTGNKPHRGHVMEFSASPILLPHSGSIGELTILRSGHVSNSLVNTHPKESPRSSRRDRRFHYLLLVRPDLHVAQGLLTSKNGIMFLIGIGGGGIRCFSVRWDNAHELMFAFIFRLYKAEHFGDPSYLKMVPDFQENYVTYTIRITLAVKTHVGGIETEQKKSIECPNFCPIYTTNPALISSRIRNPKLRLGAKF